MDEFLTVTTAPLGWSLAQARRPTTRGGDALSQKQV